jgi:hypothetical protein
MCFRNGYLVRVAVYRRAGSDNDPRIVSAGCFEEVHGPGGSRRTASFRLLNRLGDTNDCRLVKKTTRFPSMYPILRGYQKGVVDCWESPVMMFKNELLDGEKNYTRPVESFTSVWGGHEEQEATPIANAGRRSDSDMA